MVAFFISKRLLYVGERMHCILLVLPLTRIIVNNQSYFQSVICNARNVVDTVQFVRTLESCKFRLYLWTNY